MSGWPSAAYKLHSFKATNTDQINQELSNRKLDYRVIISITWKGHKAGYYQVFYGLKEY